MLEDRDGGLWIGGYGFAPALQYYEDGEFHPLPGGEVEPLHYVSALSEAADGTLWIGTGTGLLRYDKKAQTMHRFTREDGLSANAITALAGEGAADLWIGTCGGGVVRYAEGVFQPISLGQHPFENAVEAILRDRHGQLWFGTRAGLVAYQPGDTPPGVTIRQVVADRTYREPKAVEYPETVAELRILYQGIRFKGDARQMGYRYRLCRSSGEGTWSAFARSRTAEIWFNVWINRDPDTVLLYHASRIAPKGERVIKAYHETMFPRFMSEERHASQILELESIETYTRGGNNKFEKVRVVVDTPGKWVRDEKVITKDTEWWSMGGAPWYLNGGF